MSASLPALRQPQIDNILRTVADGNCCAVYGLSNTGKSPLLRALADADNQQRYAEFAGRPGALIYVDCNRVVELSATGFYEVVIRSLLEFIEDPSRPPSPAPELLGTLRDYHARITTGPSFQASLAFNSALADLGSRMNLGVVLLLDEFDEIYAALEDRTLLNLRALKDHARDKLAYVTATVRPLAEIRTPGDNEFAELFSGCSVSLGLLAPEDAARVINRLGGSTLPDHLCETVQRLAGGHFGLLAALTQAALRLNHADPGAAAAANRLAGDVTARAECLKLWNQLRPEEQAALVSLVTAPEEGLSAPDQERLRTLGLLADGAQSGAPAVGGALTTKPAADGKGEQHIFSEMFTNFVRHQSALPAQSGQGVIVDEDAGEVWVDGARVTILTDLEYRLMRLLFERRDRLTTKDMIVEAVWGGEYLDRVDDARIEKLVSRLRAKIEPDPAHPRYLLTQRGRGYKLSSQPGMGREADEE
jgi:DNA-binding winged helix-turn-helix (wHTH) protein